MCQSMCFLSALYWYWICLLLDWDNDCQYDWWFFFIFQELYTAAHNVARELLNTERTYALLWCWVQCLFQVLFFQVASVTDSFCFNLLLNRFVKDLEVITIVSSTKEKFILSWFFSKCIILRVSLRYVLKKDVNVNVFNLNKNTRNRQRKMYCLFRILSVLIHWY